MSDQVPEAPVDFTDFFRADGPEPQSLVVPVEGNELRTVLSPVDVKSFSDECLADRKPLLIRGTPDKFDSVFNLARFREAVFRLDRKHPPGFSLKATFSRGDTEHSPMMPIEYKHVGPLLDAGGTVCVTSIHLGDAGLEALVRDSTHALGYAGNIGVNCYLSGAGSGFARHYDARFASALQIAGSKTWLYSKRAGSIAPRRNAIFKNGRPEFVPQRDVPVQPESWETFSTIGEDEFEQVTLAPGDFLCIPAGTWHSAKAETYSLALNLYFQNKSFSSLLYDWIRGHLEESVAWRAGPPPVALIPGDPIPPRAGSVFCRAHR